MSKINSEDLILVNRDGVDYQAKVSDLPGGGGGGGSTHWDDIEGKPDCYPACRPEPGWATLKWWLNVIVVEEYSCTVAMQNREAYPTFELWNVATGEQLDIDNLISSTRKTRVAKQDPEAEASGFDGGGYYYYQLINLPPGNWIVGFRNPAPYDPNDYNDGITFEESAGDFKLGVLTNTFEMESAYNMFRNCRKFTNLGSAFPVGFETHNCKNMRGMFDICNSFNQPVSHWNVSKVERMDYMFNHAETFNQDFIGWDTGRVTSMARMFSYCEEFDGNVRDWNTSSLEDCSEMFDNCEKFTGKGIASWDVSSVTSMWHMFDSCSSLIAKDIGKSFYGWADEVRGVTNMKYMFTGCTVFNQDLRDWCVPNIASAPLNFSTDSGLQSSYKPVWGTCPNG